MNPFAILWRSVVDVYDNLFAMVGMNLLWLVCSLPVVAVASAVLLLFRLPSGLAFPAALLYAMVGPNPASVGIHYYANHLAKDERVEFDLFWTGLRSLWRHCLLLSAIGLVGALLLAVNLFFYFSATTSILRYVSILWLYALIVWFMLLMYVNPLVVEQENKGVKLIFRNAFVLTLDNLLPSIVLLVVLVALSLVSIVITLLVALLAGSFVAVVETRAVLAYLEKYRARMAKSAR